MVKYRIEVVPEKCSGCLRCQLACSMLYTKSFNPSSARILIMLHGIKCEIHFTHECIDCGVCADHCFYDALTKIRQEIEK